MREERLAAIPALGALYRQALGRTAQAVMGGRSATTLPEVSYAVDDARLDPAQLVAYQHLLGESAGDTAPAGAVHVLGFPLAVAVMARPDFPLPLLGMVHLRNIVEQHAPVRLGDRLAIQAWAQNLSAHRSGTQAELVVQVRRHGSTEVAWQGVSTYLAKGRRLPGLPDAPVEPERDLTHPPVTAQWRLAADTGRRYAHVSGDRNPIHLWAATAKLFGFPRAIAHGMYTAARALATIGPARGNSFTWTVEFHKPVLLPGTVNVGVEPLLDEQVTTDRGDPYEPRVGYRYAGWNRKSGKTHFTGALLPGS